MGAAKQVDTIEDVLAVIGKYESKLKAAENGLRALEARDQALKLAQADGDSQAAEERRKLQEEREQINREVEAYNAAVSAQKKKHGALLERMKAAELKAKWAEAAKLAERRVEIAKEIERSFDEVLSKLRTLLSISRSSWEATPKTEFRDYGQSLVASALVIEHFKACLVERSVRRAFTLASALPDPDVPTFSEIVREGSGWLLKLRPMEAEEREAHESA